MTVDVGSLEEGTRIEWRPPGLPQLHMTAVITSQRDADWTEVTPLAGGRRPCSPQRWDPATPVTVLEAPGRAVARTARRRAAVARQGMRGTHTPEHVLRAACRRCGRRVAHWTAGHPYPHHDRSGVRCLPNPRK